MTTAAPPVRTRPRRSWTPGQIVLTLLGTAVSAVLDRKSVV